MNKAILIGRLVKDPELRYTTSGITVANLVVAINRPFAKDGEQKADFIPVTLWQKRAENTAKYLIKGSRVAVDGRIQTSSYDAEDGTKRYRTEVVADNIQFLDTKKETKEKLQEQYPEEEGYIHDEIPF